MPYSRSSRLSLHLICLASVCRVQLGGLCVPYLYSVYWTTLRYLLGVGRKLNVDSLIVRREQE